MNDSPDGYEVSEQQLNLLGYDLLTKQRAADAVALLRLNSELYPKSANAFDSLADACEAAEDKACVQEASKRVLELLPSQPEMPEAMRKALEATAKQRLHREA